MNVSCRCGQGFSIRADRFPHKVSCPVCGRCLNVMDDGNIIGLEDASSPPAPATASDTPAPQEEPVFSLPREFHKANSMGSTENLAKHSSQAAASKLRADLRSIDLRWEMERINYSLVRLLGVTIMPSKRFSAFLGIALLFLWTALVVAAALATEFDRWLCPGEIGIAICVGGAVYIFDKARQLEIAEANWQRRRVQAIAKAGPQAQEP